MVKLVIFDFDLTLFDSSSIKQFMDNRQWHKVYNNIPNCNFYPNALELIKTLLVKDIKVAIVSNSPRSYLKKVLHFHNLAVDYIVCYHDVVKPKPNKEGIEQVLSKFNINKKDAIYIGDNNIDFNTAKNADIKFLGVEWGDFSNKVNKINFQIDVDFLISRQYMSI